MVRGEVAVSGGGYDSAGSVGYLTRCCLHRGQPHRCDGRLAGPGADGLSLLVAVVAGTILATLAILRGCQSRR